MKRSILVLAGCLAAAGCANANKAVDTTLATPAGQLFCSVETIGGPLVFGAINAATGGTAIIATGATANYVASACAAAKIIDATSTPVPVSPPATTAAVPQIAVVPPAS